MQLLTLITDWGNRDFYIGKFKGKCYKELADVIIVDITHAIPKYKTRDAAFVAMNACFDFPPHTIHIIDVASGAKNVIVEWEDMYFICADNNIPAMMFRHKKCNIYSLSKYVQNLKSLTFVAMDLYIDVVKQLCRGTKPDKIGDRIVDFEKKQYITHPFKHADYMECYVLYTDSYGNALLNVTTEEFNDFVKGKEYYIQIDSTTKIKAISKSYIPAKDSYIATTNFNFNETMPVLSVSSSGYMELALCNSHYVQLREQSLIPSSTEKIVKICLKKSEP